MSRLQTAADPKNGQKLRLWSPLDPEECARRLRDRVDGRDGPPGTAARSALEFPEVEGEVAERTFRLRRTRLPLMMFQPVLVGRLQAANPGTLIEAELGVGRGARFFTIGWLFFLLLLYATLVLIAYLVPGAREDALPALASAPVLLVVGFAARHATRSLLAQDRESLLAFLRRCLDARQVDEPD